MLGVSFRLKQTYALAAVWYKLRPQKGTIVTFAFSHPLLKSSITHSYAIVYYRNTQRVAPMKCGGARKSKP